MIVVSGALVVLSIILLLVGLLATDELTLIYFSIGSSVLAGIFLVLGALQRRDDKPAAAGAAPQPATTSAFDRVSSVSVTSAPTGAAASTSSSSAVSGPSVSVVPGRPRFHTSDCRFLAGRPDVESIGVDAAKAQGYTECGVCKPLDAIGDGAVSSAPPALMSEDADSAATTTDAEETAGTSRRAGAGAAAARTAGRTGATSRSATKSTSRTAAKSGGRPAAKSSASAGTRASAAKAAPTKAAPAKAAKPAKPAKAAAKPAAAGSVVVIPDRDKFHTDSCRFVRDAAGTLTVSKATARRQGYKACGVCKP